MYFVTTKQPGYILFSMMPSECAAVALTEKQDVHLLLRDALDAPWRVAAEWPGQACSHTEFMVGLHSVQEPADRTELLKRVPAAAKLHA